MKEHIPVYHLFQVVETNQTRYFQEPDVWTPRVEHATAYPSMDDARAAKIVLTARDVLFVPGWFIPIHITGRMVPKPEPRFTF